MKSNFGVGLSTAKRAFLVFVLVFVASLAAYVLYAMVFPSFAISGDVSDQDGRLIGCSILVLERTSVSYDKQSIKTISIGSTDGKFDIVTHHCSRAQLIFIANGYEDFHTEFGSQSDIPSLLHVVMHRKVKL